MGSYHFGIALGRSLNPSGTVVLDWLHLLRRPKPDVPFFLRLLVSFRLVPVFIDDYRVLPLLFVEHVLFVCLQATARCPSREKRGTQVRCMVGHAVVDESNAGVLSLVRQENFDVFDIRVMHSGRAINVAKAWVLGAKRGGYVFGVDAFGCVRQ